MGVEGGVECEVDWGSLFLVLFALRGVGELGRGLK
jgi:hypothetical protein